MDSQKIQILNTLLTGARVNPDDAKSICGCTRLASRIKDIEKMGYTVEREMIKVPTRSGFTRVASYWIEQEVKPKVNYNELGQGMLFI